MRQNLLDFRELGSGKVTATEDDRADDALLHVNVKEIEDVEHDLETVLLNDTSASRLILGKLGERLSSVAHVNEMVLIDGDLQ